MVDETDKDDSDRALFRVARKIWLQTISDTLILYNETAAGLMLLESHPNITKSRFAVTESGTMDLVPGSPLDVLVASFSEKSAHIPKNMLIAVGGGAPQCVVHMGSDAEGD